MENREKITKIINSINIIWIMCVLSTILISSIMITNHTMKLETFSHIMIFQTVPELILYILTKILEKSVPSKKEIMLYILFLLTGISYFTSLNKHDAFFGFQARYEGILMIYSYYTHALLSTTIKNKKYQKYIIGFILAIGLINVLYGILQTNLIQNNMEFVRNKWFYARGFEGNSMCFATLIGICYFMMLAIFLNSEKLYGPFILMILFTTGSIISGSMALLVTTIIILFLVFITVCIKVILSVEKKDKLIRVCLCIVMFMLGNLIFTDRDNNEYQKDIIELKEQVVETAKDGKMEDTYGTGRAYIWKKTLKEVKHHLLMGIGPDNYYYLFKDKLKDPVSKLPLDKAHNDYLQKLICEGLPATILYLILLGSVFISNYKKHKLEKKIFLLGFLAYTIEIFFSISVIRVAPIFWILLGLLMQEDETVTVIVPIYNSQKYLKKCLDSIVNQTYQDLEILLINDASSDKSKSICERYFKDERVRYIENKKNKGVSYSRNLGIFLSSSSYLVFVDSDDYIKEDCIEYLYNLKNKYHTHISITTYKKLDEDFEGKLTQKEALKRMLKDDGIELGVTGKLFERKQFWNTFFPKNRLYEDIPVMGRILLKNKYVAYSTKQIYIYNRHHDSLTCKDYSKKDKDRSELSKILAGKIEKKYPDLKNYTDYFYICSRIAVCNKLLQYENKERDYINETVKLLEKNIFCFLTLDVSFIKKIQFSLFLSNYKIYYNVYKIVKKCKY